MGAEGAQVTFFFVAWNGEHREFADRDAAFEAAFRECAAVAAGPERYGVHIMVFELTNIFAKPTTAGTVSVDFQAWAGCSQTAWSPASMGRAGDTIELSPEEYRLVLKHRNPSGI